MKSPSTNETELREEKAPWPKTIEELNEYIESLLAIPQAYGTCPYVMSLSAVATFHFISDQLGVTGFQASCADLDFIKRTRGIDGPFALMVGNRMCYPQYSLTRDLEECMEKWTPWAAKRCAQYLSENEDLEHVHPNVKAHWIAMAAKATDEPVTE